ncbi:MAG: (2Fe-2S)-binding protein [Deltaproteobacteria bacterium]|nr:(2Fe-2S)-binding protein [Deltaproteobacteria bacterium]
MESFPLSVTVNDQRVRASVPADRTLLRFLRDDLGLTGAKEGCAEGECGACTVLLDGAPVCSCLTLAVQAAGRAVTTIEGLADEQGRLHPVQQAFIDAGAIQCGFCTPGMILTATALLADGPAADPAEVRAALAGNLCRCTGYAKIVDAVARKAAAR